MSVAVIIPALNEEERIANVLRAVLLAELPDEVIVVSDGSTDNTVAVASSFEGVRVIELPVNLGKGGAMCAGLKSTSANVLVFFDADLVGLQPHHVDSLIRPVLQDMDMTVGIFRKGKLWSDAAQAITPSISGQRALKRNVIEQIPWLEEVRMGVEAVITQAARRRHLRVKRVIFEGVSHTPKEKKLGFMKGTAERAKMYAEIGKAMVRGRKR